MVSFALSPIGVMADDTVPADSTTLDALTTLQTEVSAIERMINFSLDISESDRTALEGIIDRIQDEIALLTVIETTGTAMEVIIESNDTARVEVVTSDATETLIITFDSTFATSTEAELLAEAISQTAATFSLNESTLTTGVAVVPVFSGIVPPVVTPDAPEVIDITADSVVVGELAGRNNVESIRIGGSVADYQILAQVVYGPEGTFDRATITKAFDFTQPADADLLTEQLEDLVLKGMTRTAQEFGIDSNVVRDMAVISIERYEDADAVPGIPLGFNPFISSAADIATSFEDSPSTYFGTYSVIEEIAVQTADVPRGDRNEAFTVRFTSDQDEVISFSLAPEWRQSGRDGDWNRTGRLTYGFTYSIHGVPVERAVEGGIFYSDFVDYLEEYFETIGREFGTDDETFIGELASFFAANEANYEVRTGTFSRTVWTPEAASACYSDREKDIVKNVLNFMLEGMQFTSTLEEVTFIYPSVELDIDDDRSSFFSSTGCEDIGRGYFPSQP